MPVFIENISENGVALDNAFDNSAPATINICGLESREHSLHHRWHLDSYSEGDAQQRHALFAWYIQSHAFQNNWIRDHLRGDSRLGMVVLSKAQYQE